MERPSFIKTDPYIEPPSSDIPPSEKRSHIVLSYAIGGVMLVGILILKYKIDRLYYYQQEGFSNRPTPHWGLKAFLPVYDELRIAQTFKDGLIQMISASRNSSNKPDHPKTSEIEP